MKGSGVLNPVALPIVGVDRVHLLKSVFEGIDLNNIELIKLKFVIEKILLLSIVNLATKSAPI